MISLPDFPRPFLYGYARLLLALALCWSASARADTAILKGLPKAFGVTVEPLDPEARKAGLTETALQKVVQSRLAKRKVGGVAGGDAEIFTRVVVLTSYDVKGEVLGYGAHIELSCREKALLKRDKATEFMAPVWFKGNVTVSNPKQFGADVVRALADLTDQFLSDYQRENPGR
jgi:hypothetical protein